MFRKKTQTQSKRNEIQKRVSELQEDNRRWYRKFLDIFSSRSTFTQRDFLAPKSTAEYTVGVNPLDTNKPGINAAMKYLVSPFKKITQHMNLFIIFIFIILAFIFASCSDDTVSPNGTETVVFEKDSLVAYSTDTINILWNQSTTNTTFNTPATFKIYFEAVTNDSSGNSGVVVNIQSFTPPPVYSPQHLYWQKQGVNINDTVSQSFNVTSQTYGMLISCSLHVNEPNKFVRLRNIKLSKVN